MLKRLVLIGNKSSKRYDYFVKACESVGVDFEFMNYDNITLQQGDLVKIDPIAITTDNIGDLSDVVGEYTSKLNELDKFDVTFFNRPSDILLLLDKLKTKKFLEQSLISTTPLINENFANSSELFEYLKREKIYRIFIKPRYGSGASGIVALRYNPKLNQGVIHTTIFEKNGNFFNGNKTYYVNTQNMVCSILDFILSTPVVLEKWISKKKHNNINYDLRVVMFKQELLYIVPRGANSPITNLHLNNMALDDSVVTNRDEITRFCQQVMALFPDLSYAGIDILITPKNELFVIEINAQGDAIYKDFYDENSIYTRQVKFFLEEK